MDYWRHADVPMCEFWFPRSGYFVGTLAYKPVKPCVSAARVYGKPGVAAESLTATHERSAETPGMWLPVLNAHMARGVTRVVFNGFNHDPAVTGNKVGGILLEQHADWWPPLTAYLARCRYALELGGSVSDVLLYLGDELDHKPPQDLPFPEGYQYDYLNTDAFLSRIDYRGGAWRSPEGLVWRLLWLRDCPRLGVATLRKLATAVEAGAPVLGDAPAAPVSLAGGETAEKEFAALVKRIWGVKRANLRTGSGVAAALAALQVAPDLLFAKKSGDDELVWLHRRTDREDLYFLCADFGKPLAGEVSLRAEGRRAFLADPATGTVEPLALGRDPGGRAVFALSLGAGESRFAIVR